MNIFSCLSPEIHAIFDKALSGIRPTRAELGALLALDPHSAAADLLRAVGRSVSASRFGARAMLLCQTGVESFPCPADCRFCSFGQSVSNAAPWRIENTHFAAINGAIAAERSAYAHFLLFMHTFDFSFMLKKVEEARAALPSSVSIVLNCGDLEAAQAAELKSAGAGGAYHVVRLGEGTDTKITPEQRIASIDCIKDAGLDWYTCCEPIGPEHRNEQILDNILLAAEKECFQNAVMRRIAVPNTPMYPHGQISLLRSAQIVAVVSIAMLQNSVLSSIAIHEPDLLGLSAGANCVYAEFGANPRDLVADTAKGRGNSPERCRAMLKDCGYTSLMQAGGVEDVAL